MATTLNNSPAQTQTQNPQSPFSNIQQFGVLGVALTPAIVAANTVAEQTFTVTGLQTTDIVTVTKPTTQAGLGIVNARVSAANTLAIAYVNATAAGITPTAAETYSILVYRPQPFVSSTALPTAMPLF